VFSLPNASGLPNALELGPGQAPASPPAASPVAAPRAGWPAKSTLDYHKVLLELLFLVLALPWLLRQLAKHPGQVSRAAAQHHLKGDSA